MGKVFGKILILCVLPSEAPSSPGCLGRLLRTDPAVGGVVVSAASCEGVYAVAAADAWLVVVMRPFEVLFHAGDPVPARLLVIPHPFLIIELEQLLVDPCYSERLIPPSSS